MEEARDVKYIYQISYTKMLDGGKLFVREKAVVKKTEEGYALKFSGIHETHVIPYSEVFDDKKKLIKHLLDAPISYAYSYFRIGLDDLKEVS